MQGDVGASRAFGHSFDRVRALAGTLPADAVVGRGSRPSRHKRHALGHDEGGVEADAELTDQLRVLGGVGCQMLKELARPGLGNGPDVINHFLTRQANAVVGDRDCPCRGVVAHADLEPGVPLDRHAVSHVFEPQPITGVRRVGDEFP